MTKERRRVSQTLTSRSTAARGLAKLLPPIEVGYDSKSGAFDPYNRKNTPLEDDSDGRNGESACDADDKSQETLQQQPPHKTTREIPTPFVDLPIGATEDRVLGSIDFSATLQQGGKRVFAPGLLAAANRGILYIDEVNLLPAHLVDVLLDAAAMGVNTLQREGLTMSHPAKFMLIGTMNPEEGDLRPQLLDRFGLMCDVLAPRDVAIRSEVVRQRIAFERDSEGFRETWQEAEAVLSTKIQAARDRLSQIIFPDDYIVLISRICVEFKVASLRADITLYKTATALAAWHGTTTVDKKDIRQAAEWVLAHRKHRQPFESPSPPPSSNNNNSSPNDDLMDQILNAPPPENDGENENGGENQQQQQPDGSENDQHQDPQDSTPNDSSNDHKPSSTKDDKHKENNNNNNNGDDDKNMQTFTASKPEQIKRLKLGKQQIKGQAGTGRRNALPNNTSRTGHHVRSMQTDKPVDIALDATLRAAAANGLHPDTGMPIIHPENWRRKVRHATTDTLILFVVDASGSMSARQRMETVKGSVLALLTDAYQQRDRVGVIAFRGLKAEVLLQPTRSVELAEKQLQRLPTGGRTPLAHALSLTRETIHRICRHEPEQAILLIVLSDGKANVPLPDSPPGGFSAASDAWTQTEQMAAQLATLAIPTLFLDTDSGHVRVGRGKELAEILQADYLQLDDFSADGLVHTIRQVGR